MQRPTAHQSHITVVRQQGWYTPCDAHQNGIHCTSSTTQRTAGCRMLTEASANQTTSERTSIGAKRWRSTDWYQRDCQTHVVELHRMHGDQHNIADIRDHVNSAIITYISSLRWMVLHACKCQTHVHTHIACMHTMTLPLRKPFDHCTHGIHK